MLFSGEDASGNQGNLWETNGTAAGTSELSVADVFHSGGLDPHDIVAFGNKALFAGFDASGLVGLWVTNGTGGGTHEFSVAGANSTVGLNPFNLTVFGNEVLFQGLDAGGVRGLWVTNGTAAGTSELSVSGTEFDQRIRSWPAYRLRQ